MANAPMADAITYGFGDLGLILFLTWLGPKIMRADLKREAKEIEARLALAGTGGHATAWVHYGVRAYEVQNPQVAGSTVAALEQQYAAARMSVQRIQRDGGLLPLDPNAHAEAW